MNKRDSQGKRVLVFGIEGKQCVWMKAGIINYKLCDHGFDCLNCEFDEAISRALRRMANHRTAQQKHHPKKTRPDRH